MLELNLTNPDSGTFARTLLDKLRSERKKLVALYRDHFETGQNEISMSLYSGPERRRPHRDDSDWLCAAAPAQIGYAMASSPVGWLATGNSKLGQSKRRKPWRNFFSTFSKQILILNLPHHGSSKDFHDEVLGFDELAVAVATTIRDRCRIAGLEKTLGRVEFAGNSTGWWRTGKKPNLASNAPDR